MILIIPLGGTGKRFKELGYKKPKPLINVMGKPIIFWLLDNLNLEKIDLLIIPYNYELAKYSFEKLMTKRYPNTKFRFFKLNFFTRGTVETILECLKVIDISDQPVLCMDGDNFYLYDILLHWNKDNCIFYFEDNSDSSAYSFITLSDSFIMEPNVTNIIEKNRISNYAVCGTYGFQSIKDLKKYCDVLISKNLSQLGEFYLSGVIKLMLDDNNIFIGKKVEINNYVCLGTPLDVRIFCNNYPVVSALNGNVKLKSQRYCFDLDNTLVTYPEIDGDYTSVKPIQYTIDFLKYLKKMGHTIIIYTARRMSTYNGNTGKALSDIGKITFDTLEKFDIPYDEIYFGKPYADYYIDDLCVSPYDDLEKELGFYKSKIDTRSFNNITQGVIQTYTKRGIDLSGEIYWYKNMPSSLKDMFPIFIDSGDGFYVMEKINGIPFSRLLISEDLTTEHLKHIMNSIERIHNTPYTDSDSINIYQNYCQKLCERYKSYNYSRYVKSEEVYSILYQKLKEYETNDLGQKCIIHGDTVLTNILINQFGKIKFIDMRGKVGNNITLFGDRFYDWAKLFQSLVGYDEILENKQISQSYKNHLITYFEDRFVKSYGSHMWHYLRYITASLLFTLIPIHDNDKCTNYYQLVLKLVG